MVRISVIIPAYNAQEYIERCLDCCINQTFNDFEVIVVNDGSKDTTEKIVKKYTEKYSNIHLVSKSNGGLVNARKSGIEKACGEFIFFLDADDTIEPDTLEILYSHSESYDIVIGNIILEDNKGKKYKLQHFNKLKYGNDNNGMLMNYIEKYVTPSLCGRIIRRSLFDNINIPSDFTVGEDVITNLMIIKEHKIKVGIVNNELYHYIQHESSMVNTYNVTTLLQRSKYIKHIINLIDNEGISDKINYSLSVFVLNEYYSFLRYGGDKNTDKDYERIVKTRFWNNNIIIKMSIWKIIMLYSFKFSNSLGKVYRYLFLYLRNRM